MKGEIQMTTQVLEKTKKVFLGGTCNGSTWRDDLIPALEIDCFNPVVPDWNEDAYQRELRERENCDYCLYTITPESVATYSVAEVVDDSNKRPSKTILVVLDNYGAIFTAHQAKALSKVGKMVVSNGGQYFTNLQDAAYYMNTH